MPRKHTTPQAPETSGVEAPHDLLGSPRREFLRVAAAAAGGSLLAACGGGTEATPDALLGIGPDALADAVESDSPAEARLRASDPFFQIEHLVVLMFENRSFDQILGYLYPDKNDSSIHPKGNTFEGLLPSNLLWGQPVPLDAFLKNPAHPYIWPSQLKKSDTLEGVTVPDPDPGEGYANTNVQLFGKTDVEKPWPEPTMNGFVTNYYQEAIKRFGRDPTYEEYSQIMRSYGPDSLPVLSTLAREFAVFDHWHAAVPSQTYCNRSFLHASTSKNQVDNKPMTHWAEKNDGPTIFNRLSEKDIAWKVYSNGAWSLTSKIHFPVLKQFCDQTDQKDIHFARIEEFFADFSSPDRTPPAYSFIEPHANSMHPPKDVLLGEQMAHEVYTAIKNSPYADKTLLLIIFDEHGGCYDHVAPHAAKAPGDGGSGKSEGFDFTRLGLRIPAIAVSCYTHKHTVIKKRVDHSAVIATLCKKHSLKHLTERDKDAIDRRADLRQALNLSQSNHRKPSDWPTTTPRRVALSPASNSLIGETERENLELAIAIYTGKEAEPGDIPENMAFEEATQFLNKLVAPRQCFSSLLEPLNR